MEKMSARFVNIDHDTPMFLPSLIADYQDNKQFAIKLILNARPFP